MAGDGDGVVGGERGHSAWEKLQQALIDDDRLCSVRGVFRAKLEPQPLGLSPCFVLRWS